MKIILLLVLFSFNQIKSTKTTTVYICSSNNAKKYHQNPNCRGLSNCQFKVVKMTLAAVRSKGMTLCKWEQ